LEVRALDQAAFSEQPSESNRIWIAGRPLESWVDGQSGSSRCCDECGDNDCRTLEVDGRSYEVIPSGLLIRAGLAAASTMLDDSPTTAVDSGVGNSRSPNMKNVQVFDPAMCCSTGVCGTEVDQALVEFAADVDWLKKQGVAVERFNLAQQPQAFASRATIRNLLHAQGEAALPVILVGDEIKHRGIPYPSRDQLAQWAGITPPTSIFSEQVAELVAIGASIASNCESCFEFHFERARKLGVADADVRQAVDLAQKVKDAPARALVALARRHLDKGVTGPAIKVVAASTAPSQGGCCGPADTSTPSTSKKCC
jgi:AhpD family alkylhydroperoxidase